MKNKAFKNTRHADNNEIEMKDNIMKTKLFIIIIIFLSSFTHTNADRRLRERRRKKANTSLAADNEATLEQLWAGSAMAAEESSLLQLWEDDDDGGIDYNIDMLFDSSADETNDGVDEDDQDDDQDDDQHHDNNVNTIEADSSGTAEEYFLPGNSGTNTNVLSTSGPGNKNILIWAQNTDNNNNNKDSEQYKEDEREEFNLLDDDAVVSYNPKRYCLGCIEDGGKIRTMFFGDYEFAMQELEFYIKLEYDCILRYIDRNMKWNVKTSGKLDDSDMLENRCDTEATKT